MKSVFKTIKGKTFSLFLILFLCCAPFSFVFSSYSAGDTIFSVLKYATDNMGDENDAIGLEIVKNKNNNQVIDHSTLEYYKTANMLYGGFTTPFIASKDFTYTISLKDEETYLIGDSFSLVSAFIREDLWKYQCSVPNIREDSVKTFDKLKKPNENELYAVYLNEKMIEQLCITYETTKTDLLDLILCLEVRNDDTVEIFDFVIGGWFINDNVEHTLNNDIFGQNYILVHESFFDNKLSNSRLAIEIFNKERTENFRKDFIAYTNHFLNKNVNNIDLFTYSNTSLLKVGMDKILCDAAVFNNNGYEIVAKLLLIVTNLSLLIATIVILIRTAEEKNKTLKILLFLLPPVWYLLNLLVFSRFISSLAFFGITIYLLSPSAVLLASLTFLFILCVYLIMYFCYKIKTRRTYILNENSSNRFERLHR